MFPEHGKMFRRKWPCACHSQKGFTLLEVMVALSIIAITFPIMLSLINRQVNVHMSSERLTIGVLLAQEKIVETELGESPEIGQTAGDFGPRYPSYRWERHIQNTLIDSVREVLVRILWGPKDQPESVTLTTYVVTP